MRPAATRAGEPGAELAEDRRVGQQHHLLAPWIREQVDHVPSPVGHGGPMGGPDFPDETVELVDGGPVAADELAGYRTIGGQRCEDADR